MNLFQLGDFKLHSGGIGKWKIDCDALTDGDIECIAYMLNDKLRTTFKSVVGIPQGGLRLAKAMEGRATPSSKNILIVDDVLTTGNSMIEHRLQIRGTMHAKQIIGGVIFARSQPKNWITPLFQL